MAQAISSSERQWVNEGVAEGVKKEWEQYGRENPGGRGHAHARLHRSRLFTCEG